MQESVGGGGRGNNVPAILRIVLPDRANVVAARTLRKTGRVLPCSLLLSQPPVRYPFGRLPGEGPSFDKQAFLHFCTVYLLWGTSAHGFVLRLMVLGVCSGIIWACAWGSVTEPTGPTQGLASFSFACSVCTVLTTVCMRGTLAHSASQLLARRLACTAFCLLSLQTHCYLCCPAPTLHTGTACVRLAA